VTPASPTPLLPLTSTDDPGRLAFVKDGDIYVINADGTGAQPLIQTPAYEGDPAWSPDGTRIAFVSYREEADTSHPNEEIYVATVTSPDDTQENLPRYRSPLTLRKIINLTHNPAHDRAPTWSPDGWRIAFASDREYHWGIFTVNAPPIEKDEAAVPATDGHIDKREVQILTTDVTADVYETPALRLTYNYRYYDAHPDWSPDGKTIAYTSDTGYAWSTSRTRANYMDTEPFPGLEAMKSTMHPAWSPDGSRLALVSNLEGNWEIYTIAADGTDPLRLTHHGAHDIQPAWSPDGQWIAFSSNRGHNWDIYLVKADGGALVRLTESASVEISPAWQP
jgi:Tol biopolymer transport system component